MTLYVILTAQSGDTSHATNIFSTRKSAIDFYTSDLKRDKGFIRDYHLDADLRARDTVYVAERFDASRDIYTFQGIYADEVNAIRFAGEGGRWYECVIDDTSATRAI